MTTRQKYGDVQVLLADSRAHIRSTLKVALFHAGIEKIVHTGAISSITEAVEHASGPDILICDMGLEHGEACNVLTAIRQNEIGRNPFICVIGITWSATANEVARIVDSGVDHLISAPMSPQQILVRIRALVNDRPPFIVTSDYIGPDRRRQKRGTPKIPLFDVPNSLRQKVDGRWNQSLFEQEIEAAVGDLNARRLDRKAEDIMVLAGLIAEQNGAQSPSAVERYIARLNLLVHDMEQTATSLGFYHISELCRACVGIVHEVKKFRGTDTRKDLELLRQLGRAIRTALYPDSGPAIAHDIVKTVSAPR
jgi:DNA-binding response OmpR family regulator